MVIEIWIINWVQSQIIKMKVQFCMNMVPKPSLSNFACWLTIFIICQTQSYANPCALIGSFSVRILHGNGPTCVFLFVAKPANSKFATKTAKKKKLWILSFFRLHCLLIFHSSHCCTHTIRYCMNCKCYEIGSV